jgi:ectoine hydroxylase-related dioxygenase (phytanoyl-CoA dioxygenase family)
MTLEARRTDVLADADVERFDRDGFFVIDDPCDPALIDAVVADFEVIFHDKWHPGPDAHRNGVFYTRHEWWPEDGYHWHRVQNAWKINDAVRAIALAPRVLQIVEQLFGRKVKPFQTLNFPVGTEQAAHADSFPFQSDPPGYMCGVWVALEDMDMENGPLVYYPGSHKLPMPSWGEIAQVTGHVVKQEDYEDSEEFQAERRKQYAAYCQQLIKEHDLQPEYGTISKGQALLWAPNLMHGGSPQTDRSRTRRSQVTHYFFEGCRVYTPMHVEGDHIYWDYPQWIRDPVPEYNAETLKEAVSENVPSGANVLIASNGDEALLDVDDRNASHFPRYEDGRFYDQELTDGEWVEMLRQERDRGAGYVVFPWPMLWLLKWKLPALQDELEYENEGVLRDGSIAAIYRLRDN